MKWGRLGTIVPLAGLGEVGGVGLVEQEGDLYWKGKKGIRTVMQ